MTHINKWLIDLWSLLVHFLQFQGRVFYAIDIINPTLLSALAKKDKITNVAKQPRATRKSACCHISKNNGGGGVQKYCGAV